MEYNIGTIFLDEKGFYNKIIEINSNFTNLFPITVQFIDTKTKLTGIVEYDKDLIYYLGTNNIKKYKAGIIRFIGRLDCIIYNIKI